LNQVLGKSPGFFEVKHNISTLTEDEARTMKRYMCVICGLIYDEADGWPEDGIAPGTAWEAVPEHWLCPECGAGKEDFEMVEI